MSCTQDSSDVAAQLLNSSDSRIAAAARRIFSNAVIIQCTSPQEFYSDENEAIEKGAQNVQSHVREAAPQKFPSVKKAAISPTTPICSTNALRPVTLIQSAAFELSPKSVSPSPELHKAFSNVAICNSAVSVDRKKIKSPTERIERR